MPRRFAQPLAAQGNDVSKTAAGCNDDLNSLPGNCPTYLARKLRPGTKSVNMIPFKQNGSTVTKWELKEGPQAHWSMACYEHMTFTLSHCSAVVSLLSPLVTTAPYYKCFVCSKGPHYLIWPIIRVLQQHKLAQAWNKSNQKWPQRENLYPTQTMLQALGWSCCLCPPWLAQGTGLASQDTVGWHGQLNMSKGKQRCSANLGSGIPSPFPDAFRGLTFSQSDIGTI